MKAIINGHIIEIDQLKLDKGNRAFKYGDGLFETIAVVRGKPRLLSLHLDRLKEGAEYLGLQVKEVLLQNVIEESIQLLQQSNNIPQDAIVRLQLWRNSAGKYTPEGRNADVLLTIEKTVPSKFQEVSKAGFSDKVVNYPSEFSRYKTMNALKYVIAGMEKETKKLNEIIILDHNNHISEALSSNIFWKKDGTFFTPPLSTGCIAGVMRQYMMDILKQNDHIIEEKLADKNELLRSDSIFTTNAAGIAHIRSIEEKKFEVDRISQQIFEQIQ